MHSVWKSFCTAVVATVVLTLAVTPGAAQAAGTAQEGVVAEVPSDTTPYVMDNKVFDIAQIGDRIIVAGNFTSIRNAPANGGATFSQRSLFSFDRRTGAIDRAFSPVLNGNVNALLPGPNGTVYVGGSFTSVNGTTSGVRNLVQLSVATGQRVTTFKAPAMNGLVNDLATAGGRLYVGGFFSTMGGAAHGGLATLNPTTGAVSEYMGIDVAVNHNWDGSDQVARTPVGVDKFDITPDGSRLVVIGNFKLADGLPRDQLFLATLGTTAAAVDTGWRTHRYEPACFSWAYDSTVRDVQISPDGAYFSVVSSGGYVTDTLCDTVTRWELSDRGDDVQPRWADYTGGDSLFSVEITGDAIYTSGHQRWMNNVFGHDYAGSGAVPRPGISAHDPRTGVPLAWNPGRHPRGVGAEAMLATDDALYIGMDTKYVGNFEYWRPGFAAFPLAGGADLAPETPTTLPANVYVGGALDAATGGTTGSVLYRVNAGGPQLAALDGGPAWSGDEGATSPLRNAGSNSAGYAPVPAVDGTVPAATPSAVFDTERWDPGDDTEMSWAFPVPAGTDVEVRVYLANRCTCTQGVGQRAFDVRIDGSTVLDDYDIVADVGHDEGTMQAFRVTSDGSVDVSFGHAVENPLVNAIEIVEVSAGGTAPVDRGSLTARWFDGDTAAADTPAAEGGLDWSKVRGAFVAGGRLYYGYPTADGRYSLWSRTFDGTTFGEPTEVLPYSDPEWDDVQTGSGQTYRGALPSFWSQLSSLTSMFLDDGRLYYTRAGQPGLYERSFSVDSGTVGAEQRTVGGSGFGDLAGAFISGDRLYWAARSTGLLRSAPWNAGAPDLTAAVTEAGTDGRSWSGRALFAGPGAPPPAPNEQPTADFTSTCTGLSCAFDASGSRDADGTVTGYAWDFGDGTTGTGVRPAAHAFPRAGDYAVRVTVTDDDGATGTLVRTVTVTAPPPPASAIAARGAAGVSARGVTAATVRLPATVQPGDGLVLVLSTSSGVTGTPPAGWIQEGRIASGTLITTQVFSRPAVAGDAGRTVRVTLSASAKVTLQVLAYAGTGADPVASVTGAVDVGGTAHTTPAVTAGAGSWVLSIWSDKQTAARTWRAPAGVVVRSNLAGVGSGDVASLVADGGRVQAGTVAGATATVPTASNRATKLSVVLRPA